MKATRGAPPRTVDVGPIFDEARWAPFQKGVLLLVSLLIVLDGLDTQTLALALPAITREWSVGRAAFGPVLAISFISMAVGTALGGMVGDRFGRRVALIGSALIFGGGTLAGAGCHDVFMLGLTRVIASIGLGAAMPNATAMVAEYTPRKQRTLALGIAMGSVPIGTFLGGMIAAWILPTEGWRALFVICGVIPIVGAGMLAIFLPESVRFLIARGRRLERVAPVMAKLGHVARPGEVFVDQGEARETRVSLATLFEPRYRRDSIGLSVAFFCAIFANLALVSWSPLLLADAGYNLSLSSSGVAIYSIGGLFGAVLGALMIARTGSRIALGAMIGGALLLCLVLALLPLGPRVEGGPLLAAYFAAGMFIAGGQVQLFSLAGQIFPTAIRATGVGFVASVGRLGAVLSAFLGPLMLTGGNLGLFGGVAAVVLVGGLSLQLIANHLPPRKAVT